MTNKKTTSNFLIQGSILAFAGILVRIIGLVYRIPLNNILGNEGKGYYSSAYAIYGIMLLLSSQSMPLAVSKLVSAKVTQGEYRGADRIFKGALVYATIIGGFFGLITFLGADIIADISKNPAIARSLRVLAPTIFIVSIIGVFRGYFQGLGQMGPTAISQIFEQIVNAVVSIVAAYQLYIYGKSIVAVSEQESITNASSYSAAGGTLGTCMGAFAAFIVLLYIFTKTKNEYKSDIENDKNTTKQSYLSIIKVLILTITPVIFSTTIYNIGELLDSILYSRLMSDYFHISSVQNSSMWGIYAQNYLLLTTMPIAIASAMTLSIVPAIVKSYTEKNSEMIKNKIDMAIKFTMIIAFPCGIGLSVLGGPINGLLFKDFSELTNNIMKFSLFSVVSFSLSTITNSILQGIDKLKTPIKNSGIALIIHFIMVPIVLIVLKLDIYGIAIANFSFAMIICVLNAMSINKEIGYKQEFKNTFLKPCISSLVMGITAYVVYFALNLLFNNLGIGQWLSNAISVIIAIVVAIPTYFITLIKTKGINENILMNFPKGTTLVALCKKLHLL